MNSLSRPSAQPKVRMRASARRDIEHAAQMGYPHEVCGLLVGQFPSNGVEVIEAVQVRNLDTERARDRYRLDPDGFLAADQRARAGGLEVVGIWHSHPDHPAAPSATDREHAWPGYVYVIVSVQHAQPQELAAWRLSGEQFVRQDIHADQREESLP